MFGKRPDGRIIKNIGPMQQIIPYIMKSRNDAMNMYEDIFPCAPMDAYIKEKAAEGLKLSYMHIIIAALVRMLALRPQLNRFVMNGRIYARPKIWISFVVHPTLREEGEGTTIKLCFEGTETIQEIAQKVTEAIEKETVNHVELNKADQMIQILMRRMPRFCVRTVINTLMWMDKHNLMPAMFVDLSPFHTSIFLTNLKSLGINHVYHHVYNFGTTGLFFAMGKEKEIPVVRKGELVTEKQMGYGIVSDERFCDGLYYALSLRKLRKIMNNPALLEIPLDKKVEDEI